MTNIEDSLKDTIASMNNQISDTARETKLNLFGTVDGTPVLTYSLVGLTIIVISAMVFRKGAETEEPVQENQEQSQDSMFGSFMGSPEEPPKEQNDQENQEQSQDSMFGSFMDSPEEPPKEQNDQENQEPSQDDEMQQESTMDTFMGTQYDTSPPSQDEGEDEGEKKPNDNQQGGKKTKRRKRKRKSKTKRRN